MKFTTEQLINFWAIASMTSLILSAVSLFFFRLYSGKKTEQKFTEIGTQITTEVNKAISEIDQTKTTLQLKLTKEVDAVITELKSNAISANKSLDKLKTETSSLIKDVKTDLVELKEETKETLDEIKNPLGTEYKLAMFKFNISKSHFLEFENSLIESGELNSTINVLKKNQIRNTSVGIKKERIPNELIDIASKFKWIRIRVLDKVSDDINSSNFKF